MIETVVMTNEYKEQNHISISLDLMNEIGVMSTSTTENHISKTP